MVGRANKGFKKRPGFAGNGMEKAGLVSGQMGFAAGQGEAALEQARRDGVTEAAATLGFSSAVAAFGGFFIPIAYGASFDLSGSPQGALIFFSLFYLSCLWITWQWYARKGAAAPC